MTVQEALDTFTCETNYVTNSIISKSYDDNGCTYKWLHKNKDSSAFRREVFIATTGTGAVLGRTVIEFVEIGEAR